MEFLSLGTGVLSEKVGIDPITDRTSSGSKIEFEKANV
jgi:hypothetical protein